MNTEYLSRALRIGFLASLLAFLITALGSSTPANAWDGVGGGGSGGSSCNGYTATWTLYGNKNMAQPTQKPTANTSAWNSFNSAAAEWCGGYGKNDLPASLIAGCKRSTFIWALMTSGSGKTGFLSNAASLKNSRVKSPVVV